MGGWGLILGEYFYIRENIIQSEQVGRVQAIGVVLAVGDQLVRGLEGGHIRYDVLEAADDVLLEWLGGRHLLLQHQREHPPQQETHIVLLPGLEVGSGLEPSHLLPHYQLVDAAGAADPLVVGEVHDGALLDGVVVAVLEPAHFAAVAQLGQLDVSREYLLLELLDPFVPEFTGVDELVEVLGIHDHELADLDGLEPAVVDRHQWVHLLLLLLVLLVDFELQLLLLIAIIGHFHIEIQEQLGHVEMFPVFGR